MQIAYRDVPDCISTNAIDFCMHLFTFRPSSSVQDSRMKPDHCYLLGPARSEMAPSPVAALGSPMCGYPAEDMTCFTKHLHDSLYLFDLNLL